MPSEIVGEVFFGFFKMISRIFSEVVLEILIKGAGYIICRPFDSIIDSESVWVAVTGLIFWITLIFIGITLYDFYIIDSCLNSGGKFSEELDKCLH